MVPPHVRINDMSAVHAPSGDSMRSLVLVLDETGQEQQFHRDSDAVQNGAQFSLHISQELHGLLSKDDVNMLLSMFDTGTYLFRAASHFSVHTTDFLN